MQMGHEVHNFKIGCIDKNYWKWSPAEKTHSSVFPLNDRRSKSAGFRSGDLGGHLELCS